ncbi:MAG: DNA gyrase modulator, partial [Halanaerobiales bacterium]
MKLDYLMGFRDEFAAYTELRLQENTTTYLRLLNGNLVENSKRTEGGVSARVYKDGVFGFASSPIIDEENVRKVIRKSEENAALLAGMERLNKGKLAEEEHKIIKDFSTTRPRASRKEMIEFLQELYDYTVSKYSDIK